MGLTYHYSFRAGEDAKPEELEAFLRDVEVTAKAVGFDPTLVLRASFDTPDRRAFARRLAMTRSVSDPRLKGVSLPQNEMVWDHDPINGTCRLHPIEGVILVVTDERQCETCFGFLRYPPQVLDVFGKVIADTGLGEAWAFEDFIKSPDPRYRQIVSMFRQRGYVDNEQDDYAPKR